MGKVENGTPKHLLLGGSKKQKATLEVSLLYQSTWFHGLYDNCELVICPSPFPITLKREEMFNRWHEEEKIRK